MTIERSRCARIATAGRAQASQARDSVNGQLARAGLQRKIKLCGMRLCISWPRANLAAARVLTCVRA
eukprot:499352-Pleurochrysis_carterae.AAC.1